MEVDRVRVPFDRRHSRGADDGSQPALSLIERRGRGLEAEVTPPQGPAFRIGVRPDPSRTFASMRSPFEVGR